MTLSLGFTLQSLPRHLIGKNDYENLNYLVWFPNSENNCVSTKIYSFFNIDTILADHWVGSKSICCFKVAPRVKHFIWLLLHGKVKTYNYMYHLNMWPNTLYVLCGLTSGLIFVQKLNLIGLWLATNLMIISPFIVVSHLELRLVLLKLVALQ